MVEKLVVKKPEPVKKCDQPNKNGATNHEKNICDEQVAPKDHP